MYILLPSGLRLKHNIPVLLVACLMAFVSTPARSQISIVTPYPSVAGNLTRGSIDTSLLAVQVTFGSVCSSVSATITLPSGIQYVPGSVVKTGGSAGISIAYSGGTSGAPVFSISGISGPGDITFTIKRVALCGITGAGKDVVSVSGSCGSVTESNVNINSYTIYAPSLSLTAPASITNANVGGTANRSISVTNGGNGCLDTVYFYTVLPSGKLGLVDSPANTILASLSGGGLPAVALSPFRSSGDTLFYRISGANAFGADKILCNGEIVTVQESVSVKACGSFTTYYGAYWGRSNSNCQGATGSTVVTTANTAAGFTHKVGISPALSGCLAPLYTITDSLTNSGTVAYYYNRFTITNSVASSNAYIDTASIMVAIPGYAAYHPTGGFTVTSTNANTFACVLGKPQNVTYQFPAEFLFAVGAKMAVTYNVITGCRDSTSCAANFTAASYTVTHAYHLICSPTILTKGSTAQALGYTMRMAAFTYQIPALVPSNSTFTVKVPVSFTIPTTPASVIAKRYGEVVLTVPSGISLVSALEGLDTSANIYTASSGNQITFRFIPNVTTRNHYVTFTLRNDSACGYQAISARAAILLDSSCTGDTRLQASACYSYTAKYGCPGGAGACPGISGLGFSFARSSYGLPDNNQDGRADTSGTLNFSKVDPDRYMAGDTLRSVSGGIIVPRGAAPLDTFAYVYGEWNFPTGIWAPAGAATVTIQRGGATYTCSNVALTTLTSGKIFRADWKANSCLSGLGGYRSGDSIAISASFRLVGDGTYYSLTNEVGGRSGTGSTFSYMKEIVGRLAHVIYASGSASPPTGGNIGGTGVTAGYACDTALYNTYMTGWRHVLTSVAATATGCTAVTKGFTSQTWTNSVVGGGQYFTAEYRPIAIPDTFLVTLPAGWAYVAPVASSMLYTTKRGSSATVAYTITPSVSTDASGRVQLLFDYTTAFANGTIPFVGSEGLSYTTNYSVRPSSCATPTNSKDSVIEYGHLVNTFGTTLSRYSLYSTPSNTMVYSTRPSLTVTNTTGTITANLPNNAWDIQIATNGVAASNVWLALEQGSGSVVVDSVAYLNAAGTATTGIVAPAAAPGSYTTGGNKWYQVTPSIAASGNQKLRVYFRYGNCNADSLRAYAGFDCSAYPVSPAAPACTSTVSAAIFLNVLSRPSEIQLSISRQPGAGSAISLCSIDSATFIVNSAQPANILNPKVQVILPTGMTVITPFPVEYPLGSGIWQNLNPTVISGGYELDLSAHTGIGSAGLKGTVANPAAAGRQAKVKVAVNTGCTYRAGSNIVLYGYANRTCGTPATGDGSNVKSLPLDITGIPTTGGTLNMALSLPVTTISCGGTATMTLVTTPLGGATQANDSIIYTLPAGIGYAGNFVADSNCAGCSISTAPGLVAGTTDVKVKLPDSVAANTSIRYRFDVSGTGAGCGSSQIEAAAVRTYPGVYCGATLCTASARIVGNSVSGSILRVKPELAASALSYYSGSFRPGQTVQLKFDYRNNGGMAASAGSYQAEIFRSGSAVPFALRTLGKAVAISATASDTMSVPIPDSAAIGETLTVKLQTMMHSGAEQCLCASSTAALAVSLPVRLLEFSAAGKEESVQLTWTVAEERGIASYVVERSTDAKEFEAVGITAARNEPGQSLYETVDSPLPPAEKLYYRLRVVERSGAYSYSKLALVTFPRQATELIVAPNPVRDNLTLSWTGMRAGTGRVQVYNNLGACVGSYTVDIRPGRNSVQPAGIGQLPGGSYLLRLTDEAGRISYAPFDVVR